MRPSSRQHKRNSSYNGNTTFKSVFEHVAEDYEKAEYKKSGYKKSGYNVKLQYQATNQNTSNKINCKRNIIWFNPPFHKTVSTRIGLYFLQLLHKHFPKIYNIYSSFNRNDVKVSYSCTKT